MPPDPEHIKAGQSKFAQILSEVIIHAIPHTSDVSEQTRERFRAAFLDGLEQHNKSLVGDLIATLKSEGLPPDELSPLLDEIANPTEQFTGIVSTIFIYGLAITIAQTMLAPFVQAVTNNIWSAHPDRPLDPSAIATAVVRGIGLGDSSGVTVPDWALSEGAKSGFDADVMNTYIGTSGLAPALELLFQMVRRDVIDDSLLTEGIKESDIKDKWIPYVEKLRYVTPSPVDLVQAAVRNQMPYDTAKGYAIQFGLEPAGYLNGNPDWFDLLYDTAGRPPGVIELLDLAKRGFIPFDGTGPEVLSIQQAVSESDIKNKWFPAIVDLARYYPPIGETRTLLERGWITDDQAMVFFAAQGVDATLATAYINMAHTEQIAQDKALAKGDIESLIQENVITDTQALSLLKRIGYTDDNANFIVEMAHFRYEMEALRSGIRQVEQLYTKFKITAAEAKTALDAYGLPETNVTSLLDTMTIQRDANVQLPTPGQLVGAAYYGVIDAATAIQGLEQLGYDQWSAWLVLSARLHTAAGPEPPRPSTFG